MIAHVTIVFTRYMMLSLERRQNEDARSLGELFFLTCDEIVDITVKESLMIIMEAMLKVFEDRCFSTEKQILEFLDIFIELLPNHLSLKLLLKVT